MLVFILGPPRSGTTVVYESLCAHPEVSGLSHEAHRFHHDLGRFSHRVKEGDHFWLTAADATESLRAEYERSLPKSRVRVVKVSTSSIQVDYIRALFPDARFVQILRDPCDVVASMEALRQTLESDQQHARLLGPAPDPLGLYIAERFESPYLRAAGSWFFHAVRSENDLRFAGFDSLHRIRFQALLEEPKKVLEALLGFVGLNWHDDVDRAVRGISARPSGPGSFGFSHVEATGESRIGRYAQSLSSDLLQVIAPLIELPARLWGFEPVANTGDFEAACHHEHVSPSEWSSLVADVTGIAGRELSAFEAGNFLRQPDQLTPDLSLLLRSGTVVEHQVVSGEAVATTTVYKQDRRFRFADPDGTIARLLPTLNVERRWHELNVPVSDSIARILERLHGLSFVSFRAFSG